MYNQKLVNPLHISALYRWYHHEVFSVANVPPSKWPLAK